MYTFVMLKPDAVKMRIMGLLIWRIEQELLEIDQASITWLTTDQAENLYSEHKDKWFFRRNIDHVTSGPVMLLKVSGTDCVEICRKIVKQIRADYEVKNPENLIHATDNISKVDIELHAVGL